MNMQQDSEDTGQDGPIPKRARIVAPVADADLAVADEGSAGRVAGRTSTYRPRTTLRRGSKVDSRASGSPVSR
jgi:hypothetical protein